MLQQFLRAAVLACSVFLTVVGPVASVHAAPAPVFDHEDPADGTVVVWDHYTSGLPTAHLRAFLRTDDGKLFASVVARLEDDGSVSGYALTNFGYYSLRGAWDFDTWDEYGSFRLLFDYGDTREVTLVGDFEGRRTRWWGEWALDTRE